MSAKSTYLSACAQRCAKRVFAALIAALLWTSLAQAGPGTLNDTGITFCGDESTNTANCANVATDGGTHPRQDARYGRDAQATAGLLTKIGGGNAGFDFTKIANNGSVLPASAVLGSGPADWACTRDNVTGLIWEVKTTSGLRSISHTYTWYSSNSASNGGAVGTASGGTCFTSGRCDAEKFVQDVNAVGLCGSSNWRLPSRQELVSIVDYSRPYPGPTIDADYFPNTRSSFFWSASARANYSDYAWYVYFSYGIFGNDAPKSNRGKVRLVRAG